MLEENKDNPAQRLVSILKQGKKIRADLNCKAAWINIFEIDNNSNDCLMMHLGQLMMMPYQISNLAKLYKLKHPTHYAERLTQAFTSQDINGQWHTFISKIDDRAIENLEMLSDSLHSKCEIESVDKNKLSELHIKFSALYDEISLADIEQKLKNIILIKIKLILDAIHNYRITGIDGIINTYESAFGYMTIDEYYKNYLLTKDEKSSGFKLRQCLHDLAQIVTVLPYVKLCIDFVDNIVSNNRG